MPDEDSAKHLEALNPDTAKRIRQLGGALGGDLLTVRVDLDPSTS
jgi:hypothetical protein